MFERKIKRKKKGSTGNTLWINQTSYVFLLLFISACISLFQTLIFFVFPTSQYRVLFLGRVKDHKALEVRASTLRGDLRMLRAELTQLKQFQTFQAQQFDEMIQRAKEQIVQRVAQTNSGKLVNLSHAIC